MAKKHKITAPVEGFTGVGVGGLVFDNGVAETDDEAIINYCRGAGYGVDGAEPPARARRAKAPAPAIDARDAAAPETVGTPLRDAAVDPQDEDFMAPVGAGTADPHGPEVVSPQVHAEGAGDVAPGPVPDAPDEQEAKEGEHATEAMAGRLPEAPARNASADDWKAWARQVETDKVIAESGDAATVPAEVLAKIADATRAELIGAYAPAPQA